MIIDIYKPSFPLLRMDKSIVINLDNKDKQLIDAVARKKRLSTSSFGRQVILDFLFSEAEAGKLNLRDLENFENKKQGGKAQDE